MNTKRRILLIAILSWGVIGLKSRARNPLTAGLSLIKSSLNIAKSTAKASYPLARAPLKFAGKKLLWTFKALFFKKTKR